MTDAAPARRRPWLRRAAAALALLLVAAGLFTAAEGEVRFTELSPQLFRYRLTRYRRVPYLSIRLTPDTVEEYSSPALDLLHQRGLVAPVTTVAPTWHFMNGRATDVRGWVGPASRFRHELEVRPKFRERFADTFPDEARALFADVARRLRDAKDPWEAYREAAFLLSEARDRYGVAGE